MLVDDEDRENEGDLVYAAEKITPEAINFMVTHGRGVVCLALTAERCDKLHLHPQAEHNTAQLGTAFTVTVDAHPRFGVTTGVSATRPGDDDRRWPSPTTPSRRTCSARATSTRCAPATAACWSGRGRPKGSVDLARLAGLKPAAVICEIMRDDGEMARRPELEAVLPTSTT